MRKRSPISPTLKIQLSDQPSASGQVPSQRTAGASVPGRWFDQGGSIQVVDLVELQQGRQMIELLVPDLKAAVGQGINDVVRDTRVLGHG